MLVVNKLVLGVHERILIIFTTDVADKVSDQKVLYFSTSPN